jgi:hypothetical protein
MQINNVSILVLSSVLVGAGCIPDYVPPNGRVTAQGDAGSPAGTGGTGALPVADLSTFSTTQSGDLGAAMACDNTQPSPNNGHHNAGQECQGCHAPGGGAPTFYLGGTLYSAASGGTAVVGGTINVTDAAGQKLKLVSADNGNFWTMTPVTYPVTVNASLCPSTVAMHSSVGGNGACNNCHNSTFRVHVP